MAKITVTECVRCRETFRLTKLNSQHLGSDAWQVVCSNCDFSFVRRRQEMTDRVVAPAAQSETATARNNQSRPAPPSSKGNPVPIANPPAKPPAGARQPATIPERIRSKLGAIQAELALDGMSARALYTQLAGLVAELALILPENVRPVETRVLDQKLNKLLASTELVGTKLDANPGAILTGIAASSNSLRDGLRAEMASSSEKVRAVSVAIDKLVQTVASTSETAAKSLASSPAVQAIEERLTSAVRQEIDSFLGQDRLLRMDHVLELFDILAGHRAYWKVSQKAMTQSEEDSRPVVSSVLAEIATHMDHWAEVQRLESFPTGDPAEVEFDEMWHRRINVTSTPKEELANRIAEVVRVGYKWKGRRLRKADVLVYKFSPPPGPAAAPNGSDNLERISHD